MKNTNHTITNGFCTVCGETEDWIMNGGSNYTIDTAKPCLKPSSPANITLKITTLAAVSEDDALKDAKRQVNELQGIRWVYRAGTGFWNVGYEVPLNRVGEDYDTIDMYDPTVIEVLPPGTPPRR